jgi:hypothetical protein
LGNKSWTGLNTARTALAGSGTQTAALAFGGADQLQQQQKNMMATWTKILQD